MRGTAGEKWFMQPRPHSVFVCHECGSRAAKWAGGVPASKEWTHARETSPSEARIHSPGCDAGKCEMAALGTASRAEAVRFAAGRGEFDRELGGGFLGGAVLCSRRDRPSAQSRVRSSENGLAGEIRPVSDGEERLQEASRQARLPAGTSGAG